MPNRGALYDRTELEWEELEATGWDFLLDKARQSNPFTTYTEMNRWLASKTGQPQWDFHREADRAAMGELLGRLSDRSYAETRNDPDGPLMISSIVLYQDLPRAAQGFYTKAAQLKLLASKYPPEDARDRFWLKQVAGIQQWARIRG